jgi:transposase InsO family protein
MKTWWSAKELAEAKLPGLPGTKFRVTKRAEAEGWQRREIEAKGGVAYRYHLADLPAAARLELALRTRAEPVEGDVAEAAADTGDRRQHVAAPGGRKDKAAARAWLVRACGELAEEGRLSQRAVRVGFVEAYNAGRLAAPAWVRGAYPKISGSSVERWQGTVRAAAADAVGDAGVRDAAAALADRRGRHRKGSGVLDRNPPMARLVEGMLSRHPLAGPAEVMEALRADFAGETLPSYRTLQRWMSAWKDRNRQLHAFVADPDGHRSRFGAAAGDAGAGIVRVNQLWEMDSTPTDVMLADGRRHAVLGVIDVFSRRKLMLVARTSTAAAVLALLRRAILEWGVPETVKTDNGADYASRAVAGGLAALQIRHLLCDPFQPQQKPFIERALGTMSHGLVELLPGYVGHDVAEREAIRNRAAFAKRLMDGRGRSQDGPSAVDASHLSPAELQDLLDRWCGHLYAHAPHGGLKGKTPVQQAASCRAPRKRVENAEALAVLLSELPSNDGWRTVGKKGVSVGGHSYGAPELGAWIGRKVRLRYDDADAGRLWVFDEDEAFLCVAECPELSGADRRTLALAMKAVQRQHLKDGRARLTAAERAADVANVVPRILAAAERNHGHVVAFEGRGTGYSSPGLEAAADAAAARSAGGTPRPLSEDEEAAAAEAWAELTDEGPHADNVVPLGPASEGERPFFETDEAFVLWVLAHPEAASDEDRRHADRLLTPTMRLLLGLEDSVRATG